MLCPQIYACYMCMSPKISALYMFILGTADAVSTNVCALYVCVYIYTHLRLYLYTYGVATISRLLKIIGLFCKRALLKSRYSAKETYKLKEPTNRSHPIPSV